MIGQANRPLLRENRAVSMAPPLLSEAGNCEVEESTGVMVTADRKRRGSVALERALQAVEQMGRSNLMLVPGEPSESMIMAGAAAGDISPEAARRVWQAMLEAQ